MKNKKGSAVVIGIIILVVAIVAGTVGYLSAKKTIAPVAPEQITKKTENNSVTDLKTYRNEKYGFEFQYPNGWLVREDNFTSIGDGPNDTFQVAIYSGDKKESFNVTVSDKEPSGYIYEGEKKKVVIDGLQYTAYLFPNGSECFGDNIQPEQCKEMDIPLQKNGKWFVFGGGGEYTNLLSDQFLKIVSTFKFTNPSETATWQTYRNEKYGFEFQYPRGIISENKDLNYQYIRVDNYFKPLSDTPRMMSQGEYYIEIFVKDHSLGNKLDRPCDKYVYEYKKVKLGTRDVYRGDGEMGGDSAGKRFALCSERQDVDIYVSATENDEKGAIVSKIFDTFKFTK